MQIFAKLTPWVSALVHNLALLGRAAMCSKLLRHLGGQGNSLRVAGPWVQSTADTERWKGSAPPVPRPDICLRRHRARVPVGCVLRNGRTEWEGITLSYLSISIK